MNRRQFFHASIAAAAAATLPLESLALPEAKMSFPESGKMIALLVYPGFTALDLIGPYQFLSTIMDYKLILVSKQKGLLKADTGLGIQTDASFSECPQNLATIFVAGGTTGTLNAMKDKATVAFLQDRAPRSKFITSVCTGSLLLAAAGLLDGRKATSHWAARDLLRDFGAIPTDQRVVKDGNRITGAGVSSGLDLALAVVNELAGAAYAQECQLWLEYDPQPMFNTGSPAKSNPNDVKMLREMAGPFRNEVTAFAKHLKTVGGQK